MLVGYQVLPMPVVHAMGSAVIEKHKKSGRRTDIPTRSSLPLTALSEI